MTSSPGNGRMAPPTRSAPTPSSLMPSPTRTRTAMPWRPRLARRVRLGVTCRPAQTPPPRLRAHLQMTTRSRRSIPRPRSIRGRPATGQFQRISRPSETTTRLRGSRVTLRGPATRQTRATRGSWDIRRTRATRTTLSTRTTRGTPIARTTQTARLTRPLRNIRPALTWVTRQPETSRLARAPCRRWSRCRARTSGRCPGRIRGRTRGRSGTRARGRPRPRAPTLITSTRPQTA